MKKVIALSCMLCGLLMLSCTADKTIEEPPPARTEPDAQTTSRDDELVWSTGIKSGTLDKIFPLPVSWEDIAAVETLTDEDGSVIFRLHEKTAFEENGTGLLFAISAESHDDFSVIRANFLETEGVEVYSSCFGQASYVLGEDEDYVYVLALPTDVQYIDDQPDSETNYAVLQKDSQVVLEKFMEINSITANPLCPTSDIYSPGAK